MRKAPFRCPVCNKKNGSVTHGFIVGHLQINYICNNPNCGKTIKIYTMKTSEKGKSHNIERKGNTNLKKNISNGAIVSESERLAQENVRI